jgi:hypothetical protein
MNEVKIYKVIKTYYTAAKSPELAVRSVKNLSGKIEVTEFNTKSLAKKTEKPKALTN